ncbi:hypothetical protein GGX14DRAFT_392933 [Mycena pura]|uniref:Uncharacterized protein n=1 Tax=Mycena pura TaxID=153505 RepID=A0AAD6VI10_9AGAR|nr:hypothetical protein GGX14DRAFT_392933 [Mycena pura]
MGGGRRAAGGERRAADWRRAAEMDGRRACGGTHPRPAPDPRQSRRPTPASYPAARLATALPARRLSLRISISWLSISVTYASCCGDEVAPPHANLKCLQSASGFFGFALSRWSLNASHWQLPGVAGSTNSRD